MKYLQSKGIVLYRNMLIVASYVSRAEEIEARFTLIEGYSVLITSEKQ